MVSYNRNVLFIIIITIIIILEDIINNHKSYSLENLLQPMHYAQHFSFISIDLCKLVSHFIDEQIEVQIS